MSESRESGQLLAFQSAFAARIRDPGRCPRPDGVSARRMRVYEQLLLNNIEGFLLACYPITRQLLGTSDWHSAVQSFFAEHRCHDPLFRNIPREFLDWIETRAATLFPDRPYLRDFMHYEWIELEVSACTDCDAPADVDPDGNLLTGIPVLDPTARLVCYRHPVHLIGPGYKQKTPESGQQAFCFLVFRDRDHVVRFISLNPVAARLIEILAKGGTSGQSAIEQVADELGLTDAAPAVDAGMSLLSELRHVGAVPGTRRMV